MMRETGKGSSSVQIRAGIDWGSSSFRAYRLEGSDITEVISRPMGIKFVTEGKGDHADKFENALFDTIGDWLEPGDSVLLSGMITSVNGWIETPYLECPVSSSAIASHLLQHTARGVDLYFLPGVCQRHPQADVMRGEELQLLGMSGERPDSIIVMPGTHSKWALVEVDTLLRFQTIVTGEIFDALLNHTLVGQLSSSTEWHESSFIKGVEKGYKTQSIISQLFTCRAGVLLDDLDSAHIHSYLSGLLIGNEISEGLQLFDSMALRDGHTASKSVVTLIGSDTLCEKYSSAMKYLGIRVISLDSNDSKDSAARGFSLLAGNL